MNNHDALTVRKRDMGHTDLLCIVPWPRWRRVGRFGIDGRAYTTRQPPHTVCTMKVSSAEPEMKWQLLHGHQIKQISRHGAELLSFFSNLATGPGLFKQTLDILQRPKILPPSLHDLLFIPKETINHFAWLTLVCCTYENGWMVVWPTNQSRLGRIVWFAGKSQLDVALI